MGHGRRGEKAMVCANAATIFNVQWFIRSQITSAIQMNLRETHQSHLGESDPQLFWFFPFFPLTWEFFGHFSLLCVNGLSYNHAKGLMSLQIAGSCFFSLTCTVEEA
jgi:hypothetical protein